MMKKIKNFILSNKEIVLISLIVLIAAAVRIPFLPDNINFNNDARIYSDNIDKKFMSGEYDVQVPGYLSYIYLGRAINFLTHDTVLTQHIINIVLVILISIAFFKLLKLMKFNYKESFIFSIIFSFNNILLLGSITGGNRLFLTLTSILLIYLSYEIIINKKKNLLIYFSLVFAFFTGFRQDLSFNFLPLYFYLFFKIKDKKLIIQSLALFTAVSFTWFIPLIMEYGGFASYIHALRNQNAVYDTSLIFSFGKINSYINMARVFIYMLNAFFLIYIFFIITKIKKEYNFSRELMVILLYSMIPALIFQLLVHNGNYVHLAAFMVPFFILLILNFNIKTKVSTMFSLIIIILLLFQFFGLRMFKGSDVKEKAANVLWLQYSYEGVKSGETQRLKEIKND